jgi:penicillin-binding protein 2
VALSSPAARSYAANRRRNRTSLITLLVISLLLTLVARLAFVQLLDPHKPAQSAGLTHTGSIVVPASRGDIVDSTGKVLVGNQTVRVLTVDRDQLQSQDDKGVAVLSRLAMLLGTTEGALAQQITPCGKDVPAPCWIGEPYQPVPIADNIDTQILLAVSEHAEDYPGVAIKSESVLDYPGGTLAAHLLGYTGAVTDADIKADPTLQDADSIGQSGLEEYYDQDLRGVDGVQRVKLDALGNEVGAGTDTPAQQGDTLVTSLNAGVQALAEKSLNDQIQASRSKGYAATSGALVVMDPHTGRIVAAASYPTYDPTEFVGGISVADYAKLTAPGANDPLVGRAIAGQYAPGSTFKLITSSADVSDGLINMTDTFPCPASLNVDGRTKTNYDSESFGGPITLKFALQVSCDTFFYAPAVTEYNNDQARIAAGQKPLEQLQQMAAAFGVGSSPGIDLPADEQATGSYADRETRLADWNANKATYCAEAKSGYPDETDPSTRAYLTELASENCTDGWRYRAGDNADMAIGQGETTVSPIQLATAYSALVNGGTLYAPTLGWGLYNASGKLVKTITPKVVRKVPVAPAVLTYIANALHFSDPNSISGEVAFTGSPIETLISGKTGTAEVYNKQDTSWFASWGPVQPGASPSSAKFVVVGMVEQAGLGSGAAAPMVRKVYEGLLGVNGPATLPDSRPATTLPTAAALAADNS